MTVFYLGSFLLTILALVLELEGLGKDWRGRRIERTSPKPETLDWNAPLPSSWFWFRIYERSSPIPLTHSSAQPQTQTSLTFLSLSLSPLSSKQTVGSNQDQELRHTHFKTSRKTYPFTLASIPNLGSVVRSEQRVASSRYSRLMGYDSHPSPSPISDLGVALVVSVLSREGRGGGKVVIGSDAFQMGL